MLISSGKTEADILENTREPVVAGCRHRRNTFLEFDGSTDFESTGCPWIRYTLHPAYHANQLTQIPSRTYFSCCDEHHTMIALSVSAWQNSGNEVLATDR